VTTTSLVKIENIEGPVCTVHPNRPSVVTSICTSNSDGLQQLCPECAAAFGLRQGDTFLTERQKILLQAQRTQTLREYARDKEPRHYENPKH